MLSLCLAGPKCHLPSDYQFELRQSAYSLNSNLSAAFPARLASVTDSKKTSEYSIGLILPARFPTAMILAEALSALQRRKNRRGRSCGQQCITSISQNAPAGSLHP